MFNWIHLVLIFIVGACCGVLVSRAIYLHILDKLMNGDGIIEDSPNSEPDTPPERKGICITCKKDCPSEFFVIGCDKYRCRKDL